MSEWNYVIAAYALTWIGILGYALHVARRLQRAAADLATARATNGTETER